ncbi:MAG TPA: hypothetical protein DGR15_03750 [Methylophilus sp.]|nr:hypothetical protein [Methylophilus sp.]
MNYTLGREWRTPPLWHGGEADTARMRFLHLSKEEQATLLKLLESL